jgi:hypothetical protein
LEVVEEQPLAGVLLEAVEVQVQDHQAPQAAVAAMQDQVLAQVPVVAVAVEHCYYFRQQF